MQSDFDNLPDGLHKRCIFMFLYPLNKIIRLVKNCKDLYLFELTGDHFNTGSIFTRFYNK